MSISDGCIFCRIADGRTGAGTIYEDDRVVAIDDIAPQAPHHLLIIPRQHIPTLMGLKEADPALAGHIFAVAADLAANAGFAESGFRVVANCNRDGGQTVWHVHFHLLAGRRLSWPPG